MAVLIKVTSKDGKKTSYLYGTLHLNDPEIMLFSAEAKAAFNQAKYFVGEHKEKSKSSINEEMKNQAASWWQKQHEKYGDDIGFSKAHKFVMTGILAGDKLSDSSELASDLFSMLEAIELEIDNMISGTTPVGLAVILSAASTGIAEQELSGEGLDNLLLNEAEKQKKTIVGLESIQEQVNVCLSPTLDLYEQMACYNYMVQRIIEKEDIRFTELKKAYLARDLEKIYQLAHTVPPNIPDEYKQYLKLVLDDRDVLYSKRLVDHVNQGGGFIAVGVAHLLPIMESLKEQGCKVEVVDEGPRIYPLRGEFKEEKKAEAKHGKWMPFFKKAKVEKEAEIVWPTVDQFKAYTTEGLFKKRPEILKGERGLDHQYEIYFAGSKNVSATEAFRKEVVAAVAELRRDEKHNSNRIQALNEFIDEFLDRHLKKLGAEVKSEHHSRLE